MTRPNDITQSHGLTARPSDSPGLSRRGFLRATGAAATALTLPGSAHARIRRLEKPVRLGLIADLHHDVMHDGEARLDAFLDWTDSADLDCVMQLGDFAYPGPKNQGVIDKFNRTKGLHVIGNHDLDSGHTKQQCIDVWGMSGRYYDHEVGGLHILVLDGNDKGSPTHKGGYPSFVGEEQQKWLAQRLEESDGPFLIVCHQPLGGPWAVDNAAEIQALLTRHAAKVALCINGHSHIDWLRRIGNVTYLHLNSASYQWVGGDHKHASYSEEIHAAHPWVGHTSPYRDSLFAGLTFDPDTGTILIEGRESAWVGPSPAELGLDLHPTLTNGEEVAPRIRSRRIERVAGR